MNKDKIIGIIKGSIGTIIICYIIGSLEDINRLEKENEELKKKES